MCVKAVDGGCGDGSDVVGVGDVDGNNDDGSDDDSCGGGGEVAVGNVGEGDVGDGGYAPMTSTVPGSQSWLLLGITTRYCYITNDNDEDNRKEENEDCLA